MTSEKTVERFVMILNDVLRLDRTAIEQLFSMCVSVNNHIINHPHVIVKENSTLSVLGFLNGLLRFSEMDKKIDHGPIEAVYDEDGKLVRFQVSAN